MPGVGNVSYTGTTFYTADGGRYFTPTDGQVLEGGTFVGASFVTTQAPLDVGTLGPPCFVSGTMIAAEYGCVQVEELKPGDRVVTRDNGLQEIVWVGGRTVPGTRNLAPIRFCADAIGNSRPLLVSPQHRVLLRGWKAELLFDSPEVLVAAKHLVNTETIHRAAEPEVRVWTQFSQQLIAKMWTMDMKLRFSFSYRVVSRRMSFIRQKKRSTRLRVA